MGKPFIEYLEAVPIRQTEPQSRRMSGSFDGFSLDGNLNRDLNSGTATPATKSSPTQDALHAAQAYFQQVEQKSNAYHGPPRTLFEMLVDESQVKSTGFQQTEQRTSIDDRNSKWPAEAKPTMSPAQANFDLEVPIQFSLEDLDNYGSDESMLSTPAMSISDKAKQDTAHCRSSTHIGRENSESQDGSTFQSTEPSSPQGEAASLESPKLQHSPGDEHPHDMHNGDSTFEWNAILRRSARSLDSLSPESFKTSRSGISSTSSRYSLSDEVISERVGEWGNGVARLVLKNSSRDSTPRTSNGSSVDGLYNTQKVPGVSKQIKDALSSFQLAFFVCDAIDPEHPILYASAGFFEMTGYSPEEVIGRNCRFLQGVDTDANEAARVSEAMKKSESYNGRLLNYKKNGAPFWNLLTLSPISDDKGVVIKYMGMHAEVNNQTVKARRKPIAHVTNCKDIPKSPCYSIAETARPLNPPSKRSERENDLPVFTSPRLAGTTDPNGRSHGSKRYSLTYGPRRSMETQGTSKRYSLTYGPIYSMDSWQQRPIGGSERQSLPTGSHRSLAPKQRPSKASSVARPFYFLLTAARILEDEIQQLMSHKNLANERPETFLGQEEHKGGMKKKNKIGRLAKGFIRLYRKLERKVSKHRKASAPSNRVNDYDFDSEIDDLAELPTTNKFYSEGPALRCESMPHIDSITNSLMQAEVRVRSNRDLASGMSNRFDGKQFCIVHE